MNLPDKNELQRIRCGYDEAYRERRKQWSREWNNKNKEKVMLYKKLYAKTEHGKAVARRAAKKYFLKHRVVPDTGNAVADVQPAENLPDAKDTVSTSL